MEICTKKKGRLHPQGGPGPPSSPSGRSTISSRSCHSSSRGVRVTILPTFVSRGKVRTASVALSSRKSTLMAGARGCFHSHAFPMPFQRSLICADEARLLTNRWRRDCLSPLPHQHSLDRILQVPPPRHVPIAAWPGRS